MPAHTHRGCLVMEFLDGLSATQPGGWLPTAASDSNEFVKTLSCREKRGTVTLPDLGWRVLCVPPAPTCVKVREVILCLRQLRFSPVWQVLFTLIVMFPVRKRLLIIFMGLVSALDFTAGILIKTLLDAWKREILAPTASRGRASLLGVL